MTLGTSPLWEPSRPNESSMARFAAKVDGAARAAGGLHDWSIAEPEAFWSAVWQHCGVIGEQGARAMEAHDFMPSTRFFPDASLSVVENFLRRSGDGEALVAIDEQGLRRSRTWDELRDRVSRLAGALQGVGVGEGDRVVAWLPNSIEAVEVMLAAASLGAVYSSSSPDFGVNGVLDRFGQIEPTVLVAQDGYWYNGKHFDCLDRLGQIVSGLPSLKATVVAGDTVHASSSGYLLYEDFLAAGPVTAPRRFPFDHPWYVLYSSGTTGVPKCIVHRTGGVLLQHLKEQQLHCDVRPDDRVLYFTTTGWMMWNWLVSVLASGATAVLYDGAPTAPNAARLFDIVDTEKVTLLGVSAKYIDSVRKQGLAPISTHRLDSLRTICSTGSPLSPEGFDWVYESVKKDVHLASISGGTDLCGCFVGGDPTRPVWRGEIQGPMLGMAVDVLGESLESLRTSPLTPGELVCTRPFPSMPLGFWSDGSKGEPNPSMPGPKFRAAYFERFDGVWAQGDFASWTSHGGVIIHGRSDTTLNPGGVRIGTAEIYRVVEQIPEILESCVFGQEWDNDVRVVLLVRLAEGSALTDALIGDIKQRIRSACTPRHVPALVLRVRDLPRTRSNKLVELALADAVNGRKVRNSEAIANPECIDEIAAMPELRA